MRHSKLNLLISASLITLSLPAFGNLPSQVSENLNQLATKLKNWGLVNTGAKSDIGAVDAWKIEEGNRSIVVAVIDTGIDPKHKSLSGNIWRDPKNKKMDIYGWNFVLNQPNPVDEHGHGTHVAGIIGALLDPQTGVSGVAHRVSIMPVKYYSDKNSGAVNLDNTINAINWAIDHGANIINYSGGGPEFSEKEYLAIARAESLGITFIAAAGNENQDTDIKANSYYPSSYKLSNIISVAASNRNNDLIPTSNKGKETVDVAAPGDEIYSTLPGGKFGKMSGTSQATAFVSGAVALLLAQDPSLTPQKIREILMTSVDRFPQLYGKVGSGGRINVHKALLMLKNKKTDSTQILAERPFPFQISPIRAFE